VGCGGEVWVWTFEDGGSFSVRSAYLLIGSIFSPESSLGDHVIRVLKNIWKSPTPSKVIAFAWKLLRNRLPTKVNLLYRGIQVNGGSTSCVHCLGREEDASHLFLLCDFASNVWKAIFRWLGLVIVMPPNIVVLYDCFVAAAGSKKMRSGYSLIWHASVWFIWRSRNKIIFSNGVLDLGEVVEAIILASWRWG
jgi:hypothetical protein